MAASCHRFFHNKFFAVKPSKKVVVAVVTFFCGGVATKKATTTMCYCLLLKKGMVASCYHLLCSKIFNKITKKNEEKGGSLPSSSQFCPFAFEFLLQALAFGSHFYPPTFALSFQTHVFGSHFYLLVSSSHFKLQALSSSSNGVNAKWGEVGRRGNPPIFLFFFSIFSCLTKVVIKNKKT